MRGIKLLLVQAGKGEHYALRHRIAARSSSGFDILEPTGYQFVVREKTYAQFGQLLAHTLQHHAGFVVHLKEHYLPVGLHYGLVIALQSGPVGKQPGNPVGKGRLHGHTPGILLERTGIVYHTLVGRSFQPV